MLNFNDGNDVIIFKERLKKARTEKGYSQQKFAEALGSYDRSKVANWESTKSTTIPKSQDIPTICALLDVDPNYLFGVSDFKNATDKTISERINLSTDNVKTLSDNPQVGNLIDSIMASVHFDNLFRRINQICVHGFFSESLETVFSPYAIKQLQKAFKYFLQGVFPIDMNKETFIPYIEKVFPWNPEKETLEEFLHAIVIDERYYDMLKSNPDFMDLLESQKYDALISDISRASFKHLIGNPIAELAKQDISHIFSEMIDEYVDATVTNSKTKTTIFGNPN